MRSMRLLPRTNLASAPVISWSVHTTYENQKHSTHPPRRFSGAPAHRRAASGLSPAGRAGGGWGRRCAKPCRAAATPPGNRRPGAAIPIAILEASNRDRLPELVPIRYGRMLRSPFTFLRGSAGLMACDLATTPTTRINVQCCGDCHLMNFGLFATPERNLIFDINDFDETLPAPWEWDLKRLAVSFVVAARDSRHSDKEARAAAIQCVGAYRKYLRDCSKKSPLDVWYDQLDAESLIEMSPDAEARKRREAMAKKARRRIGEHLFPSISTEVAGRPRLVDQPPILFHTNKPGPRAGVSRGTGSLSPVAARRSSRAVRSLPPGRLGAQSGGYRQRGHPLHDRLAFLPGRPSPAPAIQGGPPLRPRRRMRARVLMKIKANGWSSGNG